MTIAEELAAAASATKPEHLPEDIRSRLALLIADTLACAMAAVDSPAVAQARRVAGAVSGPGPCTVIGQRAGASLEGAALVNSVASRYLDLNDTYLGLEPIHPSDTIPALLAAAEQLRSDGPSLLTAVAVAYESLCRLCDSVSLRDRGWDGVSFGSLATALGTARLLGLGAERTAQALSIAVTDSPALLQTRAGELSTWKAFAFPSAARRGVTAAFLAADGVTGPPEIFEGRYGLQAVATGPFDLAPSSWRCRSVRLKLYQAQYFTHTAVEAALLLRGRGVRADQIDTLAVRTYRMAMDTAAREPEKWSPATRETADHSLPYCVAVALADGELTAHQFGAERRTSADVRGLLARMTVTEDPALSTRYPDELPCVMTAGLVDGRTEQVVVDRPPGDPVRGFSDAEVRAKMSALVSPRTDAADFDALLTATIGIEKLSSVDDICAVLARAGQQEDAS